MSAWRPRWAPACAGLSSGAAARWQRLPRGTWRLRLPFHPWPVEGLAAERRGSWCLMARGAAKPSALSHPCLRLCCCLRDGGLWRRVCNLGLKQSPPKSSRLGSWERPWLFKGLLSEVGPLLLFIGPGRLLFPAPSSSHGAGPAHRLGRWWSLCGSPPIPPPARRGSRLRIFLRNRG